MSRQNLLDSKENVTLRGAQALLEQPNHLDGAVS